MTDRDDPILDAFLREVFGGPKPPNLSGRILQSWAAQQVQAPPTEGSLPTNPVWQQAASFSEPQAPPVQVPTVVPPPVEVVPRTIAAAGRSVEIRRKNSNSAFPSIIAVSGLALLMAGASVWVRGWTSNPSAKNHVAQHGEKKNGTGTSSPVKPRVTPDVVAKSNDGPKKNNVVAIDKGTSPNKVAVTPAPNKLPDDRRDFNSNGKSPNSANSNSVRPDFLAANSQKNLPTSSESEIVAFINNTLRTAWKEKGVMPSADATDAEWCRRTFLRLIGRIPKVEELNRFVEDRSAGKRQALVDQLVSGETYAEEYAANWASIWSNILIGRNGGASDEAQQSRGGLLQYLRQAFHQNKPYNQLVYELISATGSNKPGERDYNGAVNFLLANQNDKGTLATTRVSRVFLGSQLHCAQCHAHPTNDWNQEQFWQLNAFFRQMQVDRDKKTGAARLVNRDFTGEGSGKSDGEIYFEQQDGKVRVAYPVFIDGTSIPHSGSVEEVNRRQELAKLVAQSDNLSQAVVNRVWAHFLGFGFTKPIDDISAHNAPSHPVLLERLSKEFAGHGYDLKQLMKWMTMSEAFGLSSKMSGQNRVDMPDAGTLPLFSHYYSRQMQAEELFQSLEMLANARKNGTTAGEREKAKQAFLGKLTKNNANDEGAEEHIFQSIPRSLFMVNGEITQRALLPNHESMLGKVAESNLSPEAKIEHLFLAALSRKPTKRELTSAKAVLATAGESSIAGFQDLWWVLLNSNEFILDH